MRKTKRAERRKIRRSHPSHTFTLHPLFLLVGVLYACKGELFAFLLSALVAIQHECAHAFAAARLGYKLNTIVLMPFGAVIDGDMRGLSFKDEIFIAAAGPLCNLCTAAFFAAIWWFAPTVYAFTDSACFSSLSIALMNTLPAYPLDGGRILRCALVRVFQRRPDGQARAEEKAEKITKTVTLIFSLLCVVACAVLSSRGVRNLSLANFAAFLLVGAFAPQKSKTVYERMDFSCASLIRRGAEIKRIALSQDCPVKNTFRFLSRGYYMEFELYDEREQKIGTLSQNALAACFAAAKTPYEPIGAILLRMQELKKERNSS